MRLSYDTSRCPGHFRVDNGFGKTLNPGCVGCERRTQTEHHPYRQPWMTAEPFDKVCKFKIVEGK